MILNKQNIKNIIMKPKAICKCEIGQDWYTNEFLVNFCPDAYYPDYMDVEKWLDENIRGETLNIEDAVECFGQYLLGYTPKFLSIESEVKDASTHFPVKVSKEF